MVSDFCHFTHISSTFVQNLLIGFLKLFHNSMVVADIHRTEVVDRKVHYEAELLKGKDWLRLSRNDGEFETEEILFLVTEDSWKGEKKDPGWMQTGKILKEICNTEAGCCCII